MDITKARRVIKLTKEGKEILVTLWEGDKISSCVEEENTQYCENCDGDEQLCQEYINHLKEHGYEASEVALRELELEESLPRFLEQREVRVKVAPEGEETEEGERGSEDEHIPT